MLFTADVNRVDQGTKTVGNGTVQLVVTPTPCHGVLIAAPSAANTIGENTGNILVGFSASGNASGGWTLAKTNVAGVMIPISDASLIYLTGLNEGDAVEYQILR